MCEGRKRTPADVFHPSEFIRDEMEARGWTLEILTSQMGSWWFATRRRLRLYLAEGPNNPKLRLSADEAAAIDRAFGCSVGFVSGLQRSWLEHTEP